MIQEWMRRAFGAHKDDVLKEFSERAAHIREIENTRGYADIVGELERELTWARREFERVPVFHFQRLQEYVRALQLVRTYILGSAKRGEGADAVLMERVEKARKKSVEEYHDLIFNR